MNTGRCILIFLTTLVVTTVSSGQERFDLERFFSEEKAEGTFLLHALNSDTWVRYNQERAKIPYLPASTFKIFNTMAALEAGAIANNSTILKWDGRKRVVETWNHDQNMAEAFRNSTVWFYQELARRIGGKRMRAMLEREHYGNADPSGGTDAFWLIGGLRISAEEQVDFLTRLWRRELGFPKSAQETALRIMIMEKDPAYVLRGKTGWTEWNGNQLGWYVGYVERGGEVYVYALNLESSDPDFPMRQARERILRGILNKLSLGNR